MIDKYLPIGTIVLLKNGEKKLMIVGFGCNPNSNDNKIYDYIGCLYPEGFAKLESTFVFNHEDIEHIFSIGYVDEEEKTFKRLLPSFIDDFSKFLSEKNNSVEKNDNNSVQNLIGDNTTSVTNNTNNVVQSINSDGNIS